MDIQRIINNTVQTDTGCWEWKRSCNSAGYGQLTENKTYWLAHRYAYVCTYGEIKSSEVIRHKCHNPKCCNPEHLLSGTHKDNWHDSSEQHLTASLESRSSWKVEGVEYSTLREATHSTGISMSSLIKYTKNGVFDAKSYRDGCKKANCIPKI